MNQYTLDYSVPQPRRWSRSSRPNRRMKRTFRQLFLPLCGLACAIALVTSLRMRTEAQMYHKRYQTQAIRYDSLLAAKQEADRQLEKLRTQFNKR